MCSFQKQQYARLSIVETPGKGRGVIADQDIDAGAFVIEYVGEVVDQKAFVRRQNQMKATNNTHLYFMNLCATQTIDASAKGNVSRFINHSCAPNCATQKWIVRRRLCVGIFALRPIRRGTELTFDYKFERFGSLAQPCFCGESCCKGVIGVVKHTSRHSDDSEDDEGSVSGDDDEEEDDAESVDRRRKTPKGKRPPTVRLPIGCLEDAAQVHVLSKELLQIDSKRHLCGRLRALQATTNALVLRKFVQLHGLFILRNVLQSHCDDDAVVTLLLSVLAHLPISTRNTIDEARILPVICRFQQPPNSAENRALADAVFAKWSALQSVYRIPKLKERAVLLPAAACENVYTVARPVVSNSVSACESRLAARPHRADHVSASSSGSAGRSPVCRAPQPAKSLSPPHPPPFVEGQDASFEVQRIVERARQQALVSLQEAAAVPTSVASKSYAADLRAAISVVVVRMLSRVKHQLAPDDFKRLARKFTHAIVEKELRESPQPATNSASVSVSEQKKKKIKKYVEDQLKKHFDI